MLPHCIYFLVLTLLFSQDIQAKFPDNPKPCKYGDGPCMVKFVNTLFSEKATQGDEDINLLKLDPYLVKKMNVKQGANSPVNIDVTFTNNNIIGLSTLKFKKIKGFGKDLTMKHEMLLSGPILYLQGAYSIKGQVLILPISGEGKSNLTMVHPNLIISFKGKPYEKNGETYMEVQDLKISSKLDRLWFSFTNLFNGDKALGDNMNAFLNENWQAIALEVRETFQNAFAEVFQEIITKVFSKFPYSKFFEAE